MSPFTILSIDDDVEISKIWSRRFATHGVRVLSAHTGEDGYRTALEANPDLILLDHLLPDEDGLHLLGRLRAQPAVSNVPVFLITGSDSTAMRRQASSLRASGILLKPVNFQELVEQIRQFGGIRQCERTSPFHAAE